jgi:hypothetical protein
MIKILLFNRNKTEGRFIIFGLEIFSFGLGIGFIQGMFNDITAFGLIGYCAE